MQSYITVQTPGTALFNLVYSNFLLFILLKKNHDLTREFPVKFHAKNRYRTNSKAKSQFYGDNLA